MELNPTENKGNENVKAGVQVMNKMITLNHPPYILISNDQVKKGGIYNGTRKIPRPANAFMIFANENRKTIAKLYPQESNKEISCRLGKEWKNLAADQKNNYYLKAKAVDAEHKRKFPDYVYNPKEARLRKAMRERERSMGAAQMGTQRARRSPHWPKPPHHMPPSHGEHLLGPPASDIRSGLRHELQHGFLNEASSGGYVYQPQQYQFSPQNDYATYIQVPSSWMPNGYIQGNAMAQQHIWNQYQSDRLRHQQTAGPSYMMNHQDQQPNPSYHHSQQQQQQQHHQQQMQSNQILQMQAPQKTSLHQNIETPPPSVDRFLNMPNTAGPRSVDMSHLKKEEQSSSILMANSPSSSTTLTAPDTLASSDTSISENNISGISEMVNKIPEPISSSSATADHNVTSASESSANLNLGATVENSENGFGGMQLFEEENLPAINAQDLHKSLNATKEIIRKTLPYPEKSNQSDAILIPYYPLDQPPSSSQFVPTFVPMNSYPMEYLNPEGNQKSIEFPMDFSAQKYYETIASEIDGSLIPVEQFNGGYLYDDGYGILQLPNPQEMTNPFTFTPSQYETNQTSRNNENCILDLSKESEQVIDVGVESVLNEKQ